MSAGDKKHTFTWKINNLSLCTQKKGEYIRSPIFKIESLFNSSWCLYFYPRGGIRSYKGFMSCYLHRYELDGPSVIECNLDIEIFDADGQILFYDNSEYRFEKGVRYGWHDTSKMPMLSSDNRYSDNFLVIRLEIRVNMQIYFLNSENSAITKFDTDEFSIKWTVKNLNSNYLEVKKFPYTETSKVEITLQVPEDDIVIVIRRTENSTELQSVSCQVTVLDVTGFKQDSKHAVHLFEQEDEAWELPTFLKRSKLNLEEEKYLKNDCLTLQFDIKLSNGKHSSSVDYKAGTAFTIEHFPDPDDIYTLNTLREDMKRLFIDKTHADVKLHIEAKTILAHKNILSIRSPVFSAMFYSDMIENDTGSVEIRDLEVDTMDSLLKYIYTGTVENLNQDIALKLLVAADKYQVLRLKEKCANFLKCALSDANICDVLVVADMVSHEVLKFICIDYIKENSECIFFSDDWKILIEKNLQLAMKTVTEVSKRVVADQKNNDVKYNNKLRACS